MIRSPWVGLGCAAVAMGATGAAVGCASVLGIDTDRYYAPPEEAGGAEAAVETGSTDVQEAAPVDTGPTQPPGWECLNNPVPATPAGNLDLRLTLDDPSTTAGGTKGAPIVGAVVHACDKLDIKCDSPFSPGVSDDAGVVDFSVPGGFDGYYEVLANSFTPALLTRSPIFMSESELQAVVKANLIAAAGGLAGVQQDPTKTIAIVTIEDCSGTISGGVVFTVGSPQPDESVVYLVNNLPSTSGTETDSVSGSALVFNVPPGTLTVTARFAATQALIRTASTIARDNTWVTYLQIRPLQATVHL
jgi:hypothetical protein